MGSRTTTRRTPTTTPRPPLDLEKTKLQELVTAQKEATGMSKLVAMARLRDYLMQQNEMTVVDEIRTIWDVADLKIIVGAGAPGQAYYAVLSQLSRLAGLV